MRASTPQSRLAAVSTTLMVVGVCAATLIGLGGCGRTAADVPAGAPLPPPPSFLPTPPAFPFGPGLHVGVSALMAHTYTRPLELCDAELVAVGVIAQYGSAHWNSADGNIPAGISVPDMDQRHFTVVTPMAFSQWQLLTDRRTGATREFAAMGGHAGNVDENGPGPQPATGQRLVFVFNATLLADQTSTSQETDQLMELYAAFPVNAQNAVYFDGSGVYVPLPDLASELSSCAGNHAPTATS